MFWINYLLLCGQINKTPTGLAKELGISSGTVTGWKKGKIPSESSLQKIAEYFGITKWDLLGQKNTATDTGDGNVAATDELSDYASSLFRQLSIEDRITVIAQMKARLQSQSTQDVPEGSE